MNRYEDLETRIRKRGSEIYSAMAGGVPSVLDTRKWKGKIMEWAMKDEDFKVQLFRFIDVLPALKTDDLVLKILNEYFADTENAPRLIRQGIKRIAKQGLMTHIAAKAVRSGVESMAGQFIAGRDLNDGLKILKRMRKEGLAFSLDLLGEEVLGEKEAARYAEKYLSLLHVLTPEINGWPSVPILDKDAMGRIPRLDVSLKVSSFYSQLDPVDWEGSVENAAKGLAPVVEAAQKLSAAVTLDMEHYYLKDLTLAVFKRVLEQHPDFSFCGIVLQAYLKDTKQDLAELVDWAKKRGRRVLVRLVKGAYWDYETVVSDLNGWEIPVFSDKDDTDLNFEELTTILLENAHYVRPAIATHNIRSISHAIAVAESLDLPKDALEFQMIYGMAEPVRKALKEMGFRIRAYTPMGELIPGMAYLIRRLLENTYNESFLRKAFFESSPFEDLIRAPVHRPKPPEQDRADVFRNEPVTDFSRFENRQNLRFALNRTRAELGKRYPLVLGAQQVWTDKAIVSVNPAQPDEIIGSVCSAAREHADRGVQDARNAWESWRRTPTGERCRILRNAAQEMRRRRFELIAWEVYEVGKTWKDADGDIAESVDYLEYYAREALRLEQPRFLGDYQGEQNEYLYEPRGVGLVISPWNFPIAIPTGMISGGLVTGNCVIFKPSGLSPVCAWNLVEIFRIAGLPPGVLQFLPGPGNDVGEHLVSHNEIDFIAFTGSKEVGLGIVNSAGRQRPGQTSVKRVIAEMGGKNAIIVDETADLDEAVKGVLESALGFQGQKCSACSRAIVVGEAFQEFCSRLKDAMESINIGSPLDPKNIMGPVVDEAALEKIRHYVEIGAREGKLFLDRKASVGPGYFMGPAIITDVALTSILAQEEIFGPVVTVMRAGDLTEALSIANSTVYALTGGIFSRSPANIRRAQTEFHVGNLYVNRKITGALVGRQPFGGFRMSGVGSKAGGPDYLLQFVNIKSISENTLRRGFAPKKRIEKN
ncbi:MAG TPA: L-glutamate gamma-semialdehyde dehydrogenase [Desulfomonilaceae bacterium]|nr:L-glutamate gamma-semialdehyde dehydrogenase [Desulfomonilaceae bacterium]